MSLTSKEYASRLGLYCPVCQGCEVNAGKIEVDDSMATQSCWCLECEATWVDQYELTGYEDLEE